MPLPTGTVLNNRYRIVKLLGQGGFGAVYRAWDLNLNGPCALKENTETGESAERQFKREASLLFNLHHANLPKVMDFFSVPGQGQYLVMEFIEGEDLEEKLRQRGGPLEEKEVLQWMVQVCDALHYLHTRPTPIIHRDLKPANIRITSEGVPFVVDFGIAKLYDPQKRTTLGARAVTPGYAPFEQYGQKPTDARTDIYALGATMYHLLSGRVPPESIERVGGTALPSLRELNPAVSAATEACVQRAMALLPEERYASMFELRQALQYCLAQLERVTLEATQRVLEPTQRVASQTKGLGGTVELPQVPGVALPRRVPWAWLGGGALALVLLLLGWISGWWGSGGKATPEAMLNYAYHTQTALVLQITTLAAEEGATDTPMTPTDTLPPPTEALTPTPTGLPRQIVDEYGHAMVLIPEGEFMMGSEGGYGDERPVHAVYLDAFYMDVYEVTNAQYVRFLNEIRNDVSIEAGEFVYLQGEFIYDLICTGCGYWRVRIVWDGSGFNAVLDYAEHPVARMTWYGARAYCEWRGADLPTEAQWEKAARGGLEGKMYPWGDEAPVCQEGASNGAQFGDCVGETVPVGTFAPNSYGLFDMAGNVWEWVLDWYLGTFYSHSPYANPTGPDSGESRVVRGGSWGAGEGDLRVAVRGRRSPDDAGDFIGFRCARLP